MSDYHKKLCIEQGKKIAVLEAELARLKGAIEQAFMAGQIDAGIDPSHSSAQEYANKQGE